MKEPELLETKLFHDDATAVVTQLPTGKRRIDIEKKDPQLFVPKSNCETHYPLDLIEEIFKLKGPAFLCDEISRDESTEYIQNCINWNIFSYVSQEKLKGTKVLDFGCGSGASTAIIGRMLTETNIHGVELDEKALSVAKSRAKFYNLSNVELHLSPDPNSLPNGLGDFDYIFLTAVYEHLLPKEREYLLPLLWSALKPGGILFIHQTPYRYFPIETHTTSGLPFINYMPDKLAGFYANKFSKRKLNEDWATLLRRGIRGGSISEILKNLGKGYGEPILVDPTRLGVKDRIDMSYFRSTHSRRPSLTKKIFYKSTKVLKALTGIELVSYLAIAIQKP